MELTKWLLERSSRFPKRLRHSLTERLELLALGILEDITSAGYARDGDAPLRRAIDRLNRLRVLIRLSHELHLLSHAQYEHAAACIDEVGRQLAGWARGRRKPRSEREPAPPGEPS